MLLCYHKLGKLLVYQGRGPTNTQLDYKHNDINGSEFSVLLLNVKLATEAEIHKYFLSSQLLLLRRNEPKGLKVPKEVHIADRLDGRLTRWSIGPMVSRLDGR